MLADFWIFDVIGNSTSYVSLTYINRIWNEAISTVRPDYVHPVPAYIRFIVIQRTVHPIHMYRLGCLHKHHGAYSVVAPFRKTITRLFNLFSYPDA